MFYCSFQFLLSSRGTLTRLKITAHCSQAQAASLDARGPKWRQKGPEVRQSTVPTAQQNFYGLKGASLDLKPFSLSLDLNQAGRCGSKLAS